MSFVDLLRFGDIRILKFSPINGLPAIGDTGTFEIGKAFCSIFDVFWDAADWSAASNFELLIEPLSEIFLRSIRIFPNNLVPKDFIIGGFERS